MSVEVRSNRRWSHHCGHFIPPWTKGTMAVFARREKISRPLHHDQIKGTRGRYKVTQKKKQTGHPWSFNSRAACTNHRLWMWIWSFFRARELRYIFKQKNSFVSSTQLSRKKTQQLVHVSPRRARSVNKRLNPEIRSWKMYLWWISLMSGSHLCYLFREDVKNWDSTIWFRIWHFQTPAWKW
jgi:hypothetical protein